MALPKRNLKATKLTGPVRLPSAKLAGAEQLASDYESSNFSAWKSCATAKPSGFKVRAQQWKTCSQAGGTIPKLQFSGTPIAEATAVSTAW